jgi:D-beta-D-heptose 7-phosphate kinase/D-beta-D-heptose 1-phosphate adenosyltransferase
MMKYIKKRKIVSTTELQQELRCVTSNKTIVFTNGCFDIIHKGHISYLRESRELGDILIIGLNSDKSIKRLKGSERPLNNQDDRAFVLEAMDFVDYIVIFDQDTPLDLINTIKPDIYTKAGDYTLDNIIGPGIGADNITSYGGEVRLIEFQSGYSSTAIINTIKKCERR